MAPLGTPSTTEYGAGFLRVCVGVCLRLGLWCRCRGLGALATSCDDSEASLGLQHVRKHTTVRLGTGNEFPGATSSLNLLFGLDREAVRYNLELDRQLALAKNLDVLASGADQASLCEQRCRNLGACIEVAQRATR